MDWNTLPCNGERHAGVSLFTREWIEIVLPPGHRHERQRLPLYEGVDWNKVLNHAMVSPPLVSLFTREWIEIPPSANLFCKSSSLPLYEGVDWNIGCFWINLCGNRRLPLYEGVDWNLTLWNPLEHMHLGLPLYEGVDWNRWNNNTVRLVNMVSLFTREWIEILTHRFPAFACPSPSLRGSGLKCPLIRVRQTKENKSPSLRGSGLKYAGYEHWFWNGSWSPSLRGSGLK